MKLKKLKIKSYRSCINTNLDIQRGLTALIGVNGTGKSNILNAVLLLKKISSTSRHSYYGEYKEKDLLVNKSSLELEIEYKSKPIFIKNRISYNTDEENNDDLVNCETTWDFSKLLTDIKTPISIPSKMFRFGHFFMDENITHLPGNITSFGGQRINSDEFQNIKLIYPHVETILKELNKISYYGASQFSDPSQCPNFIEIEDGKLIRKYRSNDKHEKFITDLYRTSKEKGNKFELYINTVGKLGIALVDKIAFKEVSIPASSYKVMTGGQVKTYSRNRTLVVPSFTINNNTLSPSQLSEGTFRTLALIYYLLMDENDLLLIEEPEIGVHHGLLNSIISLIKSQSKNKQILISTHSDFVLDQLKPEDIVLINKTPNKGTTAKTLTKSMTKSEYSGLKMYLKESGNLGDYWKESGFQYGK